MPFAPPPLLGPPDTGELRNRTPTIFGPDTGPKMAAEVLIDAHFLFESQFALQPPFFSSSVSLTESSPRPRLRKSANMLLAVVSEQIFPSLKITLSKTFPMSSADRYHPAAPQVSETSPQS